MKKAALLVLLCAAVLFAGATPAMAVVQKTCTDPTTDVNFEFILPIQVQVNHALWAEFQDAQGQQKDSLLLGPICPGDPASDGGQLVVKSNDDFTKFFNWTSLKWQAELGEQSPNIPAADLVVTDDGVPLTNGDGVDKDIGTSVEQVVVSYTPDWEHHAGTYSGNLIVSIEQE